MRWLGWGLVVLVLLWSPPGLAEVREPLVPEGEELGTPDQYGWVLPLGQVLSVAYSPDGKYIASGSLDKTVRVWDLATGKQAHRFEGHSNSVKSVVYSPDGKFIASGSLDKTVRIWDLATGKQAHRFEGGDSRGSFFRLNRLGDPVYSVAYSPDGKYIAFGSRDKAVHIRDLATGKRAYRLKGHSEPVLSVAYSPDGKYIASGSMDKTVRVWELAAGKEIARFEGHSDPVSSVAYSPDGKYIVSGSVDKTVRIWELATSKEMARFEGYSDLVSSVVYSPDGKYIVSGSADKTVRIWELATGKQAARFEGDFGSVVSVAYSPNGKYIAFGSADKTVRIWELAAGKQTHRFEGYSSGAYSVAYSPDGKYIASASEGKTVCIWELVTGKEAACFEGHSGSVLSVAYSPDGKFIASGSDDKTVRIWELATGKQTHRFEEHSSGVYSVAYSPDGKFIASGSVDKTVRIWELATGKQTHSFEGRSDAVVSVAYSPDGEYIASGSEDKTVCIWELATGKEAARFEGHSGQVRSVSYSPNGEYIASGSDDKTVRIWKLATGKEAARFEGHSNPVVSVAYSPDGKYIASGSGDTTVRIWELAAGKEAHRFEGHSDGVYSVAYSPDGKFIASASEDETIRIWELSTGKETLRAHGSRGGWASWRLGQPTLRHDDGRFLLRADGKAKTSSVPPTQHTPPKLKVTLRETDTEAALSGKQAGKLVFRVSNAKGAGRAYWLWFVTTEELPAHLTFLPPPTHMRLDAGDEIDLEVEFSYLDRSAPNAVEHATVSLGLVHANSKEPLLLPAQLPLHNSYPVLSVEVPFEEESGKRAFLADLSNTGALETGPITLTATLRASGVEEERFPERTLGGLAPFEADYLAYTIPERFFEAEDLELHVTIRQQERPMLVWRRSRKVPPLPSQLPFFLGLGLGMVVLLGGVLGMWFFYGNPSVRAVAQDPSAMRRFELRDYPSVDRALRQRRRLAEALVGASIREHVWARLLKAGQAVDGGYTWGWLFADVVGATLGKPVEGGAAWGLSMPSLDIRFPQEIAIAVLTGPRVESGAAVRLAEAIFQNGGGPKTVLALDGTDEQNATKTLRTAPHIIFITLSAAEFRDLLLAPEPHRNLEAIVVEQRPVRELSPYHTAGGIKTDAMFFGRERELRTMADRELRSVLVFGARQMGKTSLLLALLRRFKQRSDVEVRFFTMSGEDLIANIAHQLGHPTPETIEGFEEMAAGTREKPRIWLVDEADRFVRADAERDNATGWAMRKLSEEGLAYFVLAGFWHLYEAAVLSAKHPLLNFAERIRLGPLERKDARSLATEPVKALQLRYDDPATVDLILEKTGCRANLISITCQALIETLPDDKTDTLTRAKAQRVLGNYNLYGDLNSWDDDDTPLDRCIVRASLLGEPPTRLELRRRLAERGLEDLSTVKLRESLDRLELSYVLIPNNGKRYMIPVELLKEQMGVEAEELEEELEQDISDYLRSVDPP